MKTVGIIGGSGFIGSYNTKKFLEEGYRVRVSATDINKKEKYAHLQALPHAENLEVVQLDVTHKDQLHDFMAGCQIVVHGGTPFQLDVQDPKTELFDPTIQGTENFLEEAFNTSGIEKVLFIASVAAYNTNFPLPPGDLTIEDSVDESDQPFISQESHPYAQAKFMANETVNRFIAGHPDLPFEIISVSPVWVVGKPLSERQDATSTGMQFLFKNNIAPNPFVQMMYDQNVYFAMVDVADVAEAIFKAATTSGLHGKNYLLSSESYRVSDIHRMLNQQEPESKPMQIYKNTLAVKDLGIQFKGAAAALGG